MKKHLSENQVEEFKSNGIIVIPDFYNSKDINLVQRGIYNVIGQVMLKNGIPDKRDPFNPASFDQGYLDLIKENRNWGGEIYDAIKQIPAFIRLVGNSVHEELFSQIRPGSQAGLAAGGFGIRIDNPFEDKYRALWHQEYPAQLRSLDGLVFWSPLVNITEELGPVMFCPGSHCEGPLPVFKDDGGKIGRSGAYSLKIHKENEFLKKYKKIQPLTKPQDLVIIDFLVLHASGLNRSNKPRWTMQFRYFNFDEPTGRSHGWKGSFASGFKFENIHPELLIQ